MSFYHGLGINIWNGCNNCWCDVAYFIINKVMEDKKRRQDGTIWNNENY